MGLREWLIVGGFLLAALILLDGWRRVSKRHNKIKMDIDPSMEGIGSDEESNSYNPELPNGGARVKPASEEEQASTADRPSDYLKAGAPEPSDEPKFPEQSDTVSPRSTEAPEIIDTPEVKTSEPAPIDQAVAEMNAQLDQEASLLSGMRAERDQDPELEPLLDAGDFVSKPRRVAPSEDSVSASKLSSDRLSTDEELPVSDRVQDTFENEFDPGFDPDLESKREPSFDSDLSLHADEQPGPNDAEPEQSIQPDELDAFDASTELHESEVAPELKGSEVPQELKKRDEELPESFELDAEEQLAEIIEPSAGREPSANRESVASEKLLESEEELSRQQHPPVTAEPETHKDPEDLFEIEGFDFDRPIHELMDASARAEPEEERKPRRKPASQEPPPETGSLFDQLLDQVNEEEPLEDIESLIGETESLELESEAIPGEATDESSHDRVTPLAKTRREPRELDFSDPEIALVILVVAEKGRPLQGGKLRELIEACGMEYGQLELFHRYEDESERSPIQFSMSDAVQPGSFDLSTLDEYETPAVSFFMSLAEPRDPMYALDCMLATAETVAKHLDAEILDGEHSVLRSQTREHYRERVQTYQLKKRAEAARAR